jgi:hypothetical protein
VSKSLLLRIGSSAPGSDPWHEADAITGSCTGIGAPDWSWLEGTIIAAVVDRNADGAERARKLSENGRNPLFF